MAHFDLRRLRAQLPKGSVPIWLMADSGRFAAFATGQRKACLKWLSSESSLVASPGLESQTADVWKQYEGAPKVRLFNLRRGVSAVAETYGLDLAALQPPAPISAPSFALGDRGERIDHQGAAEADVAELWNGIQQVIHAADEMTAAIRDGVVSRQHGNESPAIMEARLTGALREVAAVNAFDRSLEAYAIRLDLVNMSLVEPELAAEDFRLT